MRALQAAGEPEKKGRRRRSRRRKMAAGGAWFLVLVSVFICNFMKILLPTISSFVSIFRRRRFDVSFTTFGSAAAWLLKAKAAQSAANCTQS